jgi:hypothetical protein
VKGVVLVDPFLSHLHFFSRLSRLEFQNLNFSLSLHNLLSFALIQTKKLGNSISHEGVISFFWWKVQSCLVPSSVLTHLHLFTHFSCLEFQNPNFSMPLYSSLSSLWFKLKNSEIQYRTRELWAFSGEGAAQSWSVLVGPKGLKRWRCIRIEERTDQNCTLYQKKLIAPSCNIGFTSFFGLIRSAREQAMKWPRKVWILKLRVGETAEKVKMCHNWGRD